MLGGTTAFLGKIGMLTFFKMQGIDQEKVHLQIERVRPLLDQGSLLLQCRRLFRSHIGTMADPDIEVAGLGIGDGSAAAHHEQGIDIVTRQGLAPVIEADRDLLDRVQSALARPIIGHTDRAFIRHIARQDRMINMK